MPQSTPNDRNRGPVGIVYQHALSQEFIETRE